jgi:hypothetical protein
LPLSTVLSHCTWPRPNMNPGSTDQINSYDGEIHHGMVLINQGSTVVQLLCGHYIHMTTASNTPNQHQPTFEPVYISFGIPQNGQKRHKNLFSGCFGLFPLKE